MSDQAMTMDVPLPAASFNVEQWDSQYPLKVGEVIFDIQNAPPTGEMIDAARLALVREKSRRGKTWIYLVAAIAVSIIPAVSNDHAGVALAGVVLAGIPIVTFLVSLLIFAMQDENCRLLQHEIELLEPIEAQNAQTMADLLRRYDGDGQPYKRAVLESGRPFVNAELLMLSSYAAERAGAAALDALYEKEE